ncbi:MAG TPA: hypothetical protein VK477_04530 [Acidobacteriota bacterium]|nr:hypothetical protein [Acidobacteriota bacterium]
MTRIQKRAQPRASRRYCIQSLTDLVFSPEIVGSTELKVRALASCLSPRQRQTLAADFRRASA